MSRSTVAIVGAGLAGARTAEALRARGYDGDVVLVGEEPHPPYERPALSKSHLIDGPLGEKILVNAEDWYDEHEVELVTGHAVTGFDPRERRLSVAGTAEIRYRALVLTTGAGSRRLRLPGADLAGVHHLRTVEDSTALYAALGRRPRTVVIGGGWIGLEVAAAATSHGAEVTVLEQAPVPMEHVLGARMAGVLLRAHRDHGVDVRGGVHVTALRQGGRGRVAGVVLADGRSLDADVVVVGIGAEPRTELALQGGLEVSNGVVVDAGLRSSAPAIYAAGDVANAWHPTLHRRLRVEHWDNALHQPDTVAASILGVDSPYDRLPYFFSDQYDLGLEYTGWVDPAAAHEVVVRGDEESGRFMAFWVRDGAVAAGMGVNEWGQVDAVQALIRSGAVVDASLLADTDVPLEQLQPPGAS
ncbi:NAD(P)/FAD-dependent oxidoreductase [Knoellia sp. p5-6-4]|uniref:NAD(P)/FAD-dependent oxidoreductase n=1 Tax=unclassified Knoellia TaxID=2618719 RepID=UPI0023DA3802|nr:FAD-dependent oxidoreductase [Knoellia sp. p5-6-4]MDF2143515.1 FAD-dependent oxidoreductase [Knoellia sp. p5-6-4]